MNIPELEQSLWRAPSIPLDVAALRSVSRPWREHVIKRRLRQAQDKRMAEMRDAMARLDQEISLRMADALYAHRPIWMRVRDWLGEKFA